MTQFPRESATRFSRENRFFPGIALTRVASGEIRATHFMRVVVPKPLRTLGEMHQTVPISMKRV
ncbi:MAG: hypothetical protein E5W81_08495 [Mesorhizobium sp.]|nr:MAG: hypothetical protein E5W81_08495 [Mesorhizobium sp.]